MRINRCNILELNRVPLLFFLCSFSVWKSESGNVKPVWRNVNGYN